MRRGGGDRRLVSPIIDEDVPRVRDKRGLHFFSGAMKVRVLEFTCKGRKAEQERSSSVKRQEEWRTNNVTDRAEKMKVGSEKY